MQGFSISVRLLLSVIVLLALNFLFSTYVTDHGYFHGQCLDLAPGFEHERRVLDSIGLRLGRQEPNDREIRRNDLQPDRGRRGYDLYIVGLTHIKYPYL